ncbi:hypothetical protein ABT279_39745, partial [Amycolatopsis sp. NPDC000673]|uniref:hypothetical protein n=1 Tax=Amycolatopsis sp. NPDC000673 TaxID=3154267 RepID=UPI003319C668
GCGTPRPRGFDGAIRRNEPACEARRASRGTPRSGVAVSAVAIAVAREASAVSRVAIPMTGDP